MPDKDIPRLGPAQVDEREAGEEKREKAALAKAASSRKAAGILLLRANEMFRDEQLRGYAKKHGIRSKDPAKIRAKLGPTNQPSLLNIPGYDRIRQGELSDEKFFEMAAQGKPYISKALKRQAELEQSRKDKDSQEDYTIHLARIGSYGLPEQFDAKASDAVAALNLAAALPEAMTFGAFSVENVAKLVGGKDAQKRAIKFQADAMLRMSPAMRTAYLAAMGGASIAGLRAPVGAMTGGVYRGLLSTGMSEARAATIASAASLSFYSGVTGGVNGRNALKAGLMGGAMGVLTPAASKAVMKMFQGAPERLQIMAGEVIGGQIAEIASRKARGEPVTWEDLAGAGLVDIFIGARSPIVPGAGVKGAALKPAAADEAPTAAKAPGEGGKGAKPGGESYPEAGDMVDGRKVRKHIPNTESISASLGSDTTELPGIREVPMSAFELTGRHYSVRGNKRIKELAEEIKASGEINPLIVAIDAEGPYILEGATRAEALYRLGAKSFPAAVVYEGRPPKPGGGETPDNRVVPLDPELASQRASSLQAAQRGQADMTMAPKLVGRMIDLATRGLSTLARNTPLNDMVDRVRVQGGAGKRMAALAERAMDSTQEMRSGDLLRSYTAALEKAGIAHPLFKMKTSRADFKASSDLQKLRPVGDKGAMTNDFVEVAEGRSRPSTQIQQDMIDHIKAFQREIGDATQREGLLMVDRNGDVVPVGIIGDKLLMRVQHPDLISVMRKKGPGDREWDAVVDAIASMPRNKKIGREKIEKWMEEMGEAFEGEGPMALQKQTQAEHARVFPDFPAAVKLPNGEIIRTLATSPHEWLVNVFHRRTARLGVVRHFGQEFTKEEITASARKQLNAARNRGDQAAMDTAEAMIFRLGQDAPRPDRMPSALVKKTGGRGRALMRALHEIPVEAPWVMAGDKIGGPIMRSMSAAKRILSESWMSAGTQVVNTVEPSMFAGVLGTKENLKGLGRSARKVGKAITLHKDVAREIAMKELEDLGLVLPDIANFSLDHSRPWSSAGKAVAELIGRGSGRRQAEQLGETEVGFQVLGYVRNMETRNGMSGDARKDIQHLRAMGFGRAKATKMAMGRADRADYDRAARTISAKMQGGLLKPAQKSRLENNNWVKALTVFRLFSSMRMRFAGNEMATYFRSMGEAFEGKTPYNQNWAQGVAATRAFASSMGGIAISTALGGALMATVKDGIFGLEQQAEEKTLKEHIVNNLFQGVFSGANAQVLRGIRGEAGIENAIMPWGLFDDVSHALKGEGQYRNFKMTDRIRMLVDRLAPLPRAAESAWTAWGMGGDDAKGFSQMKASVRAYWRWRFNTKDMVDAPEGMEDRGVHPHLEGWAQNMEKARDALRREKPTYVVNGYVNDALRTSEGKSLSDVKQRLKSNLLLDWRRWRKDGRKLDLDQAEAAYKDLRSRMSDGVWSKLELHDTLIKRQIAAVDRRMERDRERNKR